MRFLWIIISLVFVGSIGVQDSYSEKVVGIRGMIFENGTTILDPWYRIESKIDIPLDNPGDVRIQYYDINDEKIAETGFNYEPTCLVNGDIHCFDFMGFLLRIPDIGDFKKIVLLRDNQFLSEKVVSSNLPAVKITYPNGGEVFKKNEAITVKWESFDLDGDDLTFMIQISYDDGNKWHTSSLDVPTNEFEFTFYYYVSDSTLIRITANDGINTTSDVSDGTFTVIDDEIFTEEENNTYTSPEELDLEYGEYLSPENSWIELTHSAYNPPPWKLDWIVDNPSESYSKKLKEVHGELEIIKEFYEKHDIVILDAIRSLKNAQMCEALGCLSGTYHLLIPNEHVEKFQNNDFGFIRFANSGIVESSVGDLDNVQARWQAEHLSLFSNGDFRLKLNLFYDSEDPPTSSYYCSGCGGNTIVETTELKFIGSIVLLTFPYGSYGEITPIIVNTTDAYSSIDYSDKLVLSENSKSGNSVNFGLGWIRVFEDQDKLQYYQWMRSGSSNTYRMNEVHSSEGTFFSYSAFPEYIHKHNDSSLRGFDYVAWIKNNIIEHKPTSQFISDNISPLKQIQSGYPIEHVKCKEGLDLIFKSSNGSPACVEPASIEKLIERGWAHENPFLILTINQNEFQKNDFIKITLQNISNKTLQFSDSNYGTSYSDSNNENNCCGGYAQVVFLNPYQKSEFSLPLLESGNYVLTATGNVMGTNEVIHLSKSFIVENEFSENKTDDVTK